MDEIFAEVNLTNIHKSFYKKKDLVKIKENNSDMEQNNPEHKTVDSNDENAGIDLTQEPEKPKNSMNELILSTQTKSNEVLQASQQGVG